MAKLIVHGRVAVQTVTALANLLRPPLPPDFPQNPFPVDAQIGGPGVRWVGWISFGKTREMSVSDGGAGLYCWESVLVAGAQLGSAGPGPRTRLPVTAAGFPAAAADNRRPSWIQSPASRRPTPGQHGRLAGKYFNVNCNSMKIGTTRSAAFPSSSFLCCPRPEPNSMSLSQILLHFSCIASLVVSQEVVTWNAWNLIFS